MHVVGWEQDLDPQLRVSGGLTQSESGLTFQAGHPMCTLATVNALVPTEWERNIEAWRDSDIIRKGELRRHGGYYWRAKKESKGQEPPAADFSGDYNEDFGNEYWLATTLLSEKCEQLTRRGVQNAVQKWMTSKQLNKESRTLLEHRAIFDGAGRLQNVSPNRDKIVGFELVAERGMGVTVKIDKIGLQFNARGRVTIYVFHTSQSEPVYEYTVGYDRDNGTFKWFEPQDWYLPYMGSTGIGGAWYICYVQRDLLPEEGVMEAVKVDMDWKNGPCHTCGVGNYQHWRELLQYVDVSPFEVSVPGGWDKADPKLWDISNNVYPGSGNYGLNVMFSAMCDVTDLIIQNRQQFAGVIQKETAFQVLKALELNPDVVVSRMQSNATHSDLRYELDGSAATYKKGLITELEKAYAALYVETQGMDKVCLGCNNRGIRFRMA